MSIYDSIEALLQEKKTAFLAYEQATDGLIMSNADTAPAFMQRRQELMDQISEIDDRIAALCFDADDGKLIALAVKNKCDRAQLPKEICPLFDLAQQIFAVINRIRQMEPQALDRMIIEKEALLAKIKDTNQGVGAKASRYYNSGFHTSDTGFLQSKA